MVGIDFADTIVVRRTVEKGTRVIEERVKKLTFAGTEFKKYLPSSFFKYQNNLTRKL